MVLFVKGLEMVKTKCVLHRFILFMGTISLESYLANVFVTYALEEFDFQPLGIWAEGNYLFYLLVIIIGMTIAVYANRFSNYLTK